MITNLEHYKRFFVFGCSFTNYVYPTWADVLASEMPNVNYYNFGIAGAGNPMISARITEANKKFNFNENDLVIVMFTSFYREDRYLQEKGGWIPRGNVFNGCLYGDTWVREFADPLNYLLRDLSLIELTTAYLKSLPCKSICLMSSDIDSDLKKESDLFNYTKYIKVSTELLDIYKSTIENFPTTLQKHFVKAGCWPIGHSYKWNGSMFDDSHPNPQMYFEYLKTIGFNLSDKSLNYVNKSMNDLKLCLDRTDFPKVFREVDENTSRSWRELF